MGETEEDKLLSDAMLLVNLVLKFSRHSKWLMAPRTFRAALYFLAVFFGGNTAFENAQKIGT